MNTLHFKLEQNNYDEIVTKSGEIIRNGGLVAFPTETVYGLGGDALNPLSSFKIYEAKGRPSDNPLIVHVSERDDIFRISKDLNDNALKLIDAFMPGPITLIVNKSDNVPYETTGGLDTVGIRMPSHELARDFIKAAGGFVAAPSANISGRPSPTLARYVLEDLNGKIDAVIDDGKSVLGLESTIVDTTSNPVTILRPGFITISQIQQVVGICEYDKGLKDDSNARPKAPGMKYKHYAPKAQVIAYKGNKSKVFETILNQINDTPTPNKTAIIIPSDYECYNNSNFDDALSIKINSLNYVEEFANNLYLILRKLDDNNIEKCYIDISKLDEFNDNELVSALMNRLSKACSGNIINLD